jgi:peptide/nickel transport system substrate-binding protein
MGARPVIVVAVVVLAGVAPTATSDAAGGNAADTAVAARAERAARDSLLRDEQVSPLFMALGLGSPVRTEAQFAAPDRPECAEFRDALEFANRSAVVTGVRFSAEGHELLQTVYSFRRARAASEFESLVLDADLVACSQATAPPATPGSSSTFDIADARGSDLTDLVERADLSDPEALFFATFAQLTVAPAGGTSQTSDFTTFWLHDRRLVTRIATRYADVAVYDADAPTGLTPVAEAPVAALVDAAAVGLAAAGGLQLGIGIPSSPVPWQTRTACDVRTNGLVYGTLLSQRRNGTLSSDLLEDWEVADDGLSYRITLRDDLAWSDGAPMTADDVVSAFDAYRGNPSSASVLGPIGTIAKVDDLTIEVTFTNPVAASGLWALSGAAGVVAKPGTPFPSSAGPFVYTSYVTGAPDGADPEVVVDNWSDLANLAPVLTFNAVPLGGGLSMLQDGTVDIAVIPPSAIDDAKADGFRVSASPTGSGAALYFNYRAHELFDDVLVRRAFALAIDRDAIIKSVLGGNGTATDVPIGPGWGFDPDLVYEYDPDRAAELLDEAGWAFDETLGVRVFDGTAGGDSALITERLRADLAAIGIDLDVRTVSGTELSTSIADGSADVIVLSLFQAPYGSDTVGQAIVPTSNVARGLGADSAFADSQLLQLVEDAAGAADTTERKKLYAQIQEIFAEELPYVWLYASPYAIAYDDVFVTGTVRAPRDPCGRWGLQDVGAR